MDLNFGIYEDVKEERLHKMLSDLTNDLKTHYHIEKAEVAYQRMEANTLLNLTDCYHTLLEKQAEKVDIYTEQVLNLKKFEMENNMYSHIINIRRSNKKVQESFEFLAPVFENLKNTSKEIEWSTKNPEPVGDYNVGSMRNYVEIAFDLRRDFRRRIIDRNVMQDMLNIKHSITVEVYQELLQQQDEFNDVFAKLVFFSEVMES